MPFSHGKPLEGIKRWGRGVYVRVYLTYKYTGSKLILRGRGSRLPKKWPRACSRMWVLRVLARLCQDPFAFTCTGRDHIIVNMIQTIHFLNFFISCYPMNTVCEIANSSSMQLKWTFLHRQADANSPISFNDIQNYLIMLKIYYFVLQLRKLFLTAMSWKTVPFCSRTTQAKRALQWIVFAALVTAKWSLATMFVPTQAYLTPYSSYFPWRSWKGPSRLVLCQKFVHGNKKMWWTGTSSLLLMYFLVLFMVSIIVTSIPLSSPRRYSAFKAICHHLNGMINNERRVINIVICFLVQAR